MIRSTAKPACKMMIRPPGACSKIPRTKSTHASLACAYLRVSSSTQSLRDSIYDYVEENGRRFHRFKQGSKFPPELLELLWIWLTRSKTICFQTMMSVLPIRSTWGGVVNRRFRNIDGAR
jgi:hypothetical protein